MDQTLRDLERAAGHDPDAARQLAAARVRAGALVALARVDARAQDDEARAKGRWPRVYLWCEKGGGDLTPRARRAALREVLARLAWSDVKATWSLRAGCQCGCSPGYVLKGAGARGRGDVFVDVFVDPREREPEEAA